MNARVQWCNARVEGQEDSCFSPQSSHTQKSHMLMENEPFLTALTLMFYDGRSKGAVTVTMKRYDGRNRPEPRPGTKNAAKNPLPKPEQYQCLVRARLRQKKISTVVSGQNVEKFQEAYSKLMLSSMDSLKRVKKAKTARMAQ
ncbi:signal recognition particle 14 kDa protein-like isoform X1 [Amphibalanus amphitrite]|uniref:signal recognition particle 14 kDa protein-like isoform X1 n=1 Tax=Amphibalanus amphitrite TaxID=1232801 RepID=UPI001C92A6C7|nr:signal recognition particle 14 kDa protein-like isoform X1 [Amphibalanus amphitrite]